MVLAQMLLARRLLSVVSRFLRIRTFPALAGIVVVVWVRLNVGGGAALFCALRGGCYCLSVSGGVVGGAARKSSA